jgi:hypothetical protein
MEGRLRRLAVRATPRAPDRRRPERPRHGSRRGATSPPSGATSWTRSRTASPTSRAS